MARDPEECIISRPSFSSLFRSRPSGLRGGTRRPLRRLAVVLTTLATALALSLGLLSVPAAQAKAPKKPAKITSLTVTQGSRPGEAVLRWKTSGKNTRYFVLETGLTAFSPTKKSLPRHGRYPHRFFIPASARSWVMTPARAAQAHAALGSGRHLYLRLFAVNKVGTKTRARAFAKERTLLLKGMARKSGTLIRAATFNVRTSRAADGARNWTRRASSVAAEIRSRRPAVVMMQELGPGRADGSSAPLSNATRQTTSLVSELRRQGARSYALVRSTAYVAPYSPRTSQGARILYDSAQVRLLSRCPESTEGVNYAYNASCSFALPSDSSERRRAAFAMFAEVKTGKRFAVVSAHLDPRHSTNRRIEGKLAALRGKQAAAAADGAHRYSGGNVPIIFGGDLNSYQTIAVNNAPHNALLARRFVDSAAAGLAYGLKYPTVNHFRTRVKAFSAYGPRLDVVMARGVKGINRHENKLVVTNSKRPSDHNMVVGDIII